MEARLDNKAAAAAVGGAGAGGSSGDSSAASGGGAGSTSSTSSTSALPKGRLINLLTDMRSMYQQTDVSALNRGLEPPL